MKRKTNWVDNTIAFFSPRTGLRRLNARRSYEAASSGRRASSFKNAGYAGPNIEVSQAFVKLRNRSRHFVRNNGWAKRAIDAITDNTIGQGIRPAPAGTKNQVKKIKALWRSWAETTVCDYDGNNTFYGLQNLIMSEIAEAGDCLVIRRRVNESIPIKIQVLEGDQLDQSKDYVNDLGFARLGVQFNNEGKRIGYWVWPRHPYDMTGQLQTIQSEFVSIDDVIHPFEILRAGQVRGVPMGVSAFMKMSDFSDYEDAQLMRQKCAACFTAFVTGSQSDEDKLEDLEPGIINYLHEEEQVTFSSPPKADGYSEYSTKILQGIAAAYGITYEMLTMDYGNVNFTSGRMAKIDISPRFRKWQYNMIVPMVCVPVWNWFMSAVIMSGQSTTFISCEANNWTAPRVQQLDPVKETNARVLQIQAGLSTLSECIREDGRDPEEFFEEYKNDMDKIKELGINLSSISFAPVETKVNENA